MRRWLALALAVLGSSAALRTQIQKGAAADALISADLATAQGVVTDHLAGGPATPLAADRLAIVVPAANHARLRTPKDLARSGVRIVGAVASVPISIAANQLLAALAKLSGHPAAVGRVPRLADGTGRAADLRVTRASAGGDDVAGSQAVAWRRDAAATGSVGLPPNNVPISQEEMARRPPN